MSPFQKFLYHATELYNATKTLRFWLFGAAASVSTVAINAVLTAILAPFIVLEERSGIIAVIAMCIAAALMYRLFYGRRQ